MQARIRSLKLKVFWNPIIRFLILESMKLNMAAIVVFKLGGAGAADIATSIAFLAVLIGAPVVFFVVMYKNDDQLSSETTKKEIGSIYAGKNVDTVSSLAYFYHPMAFFWRRTLFIVITVFLFDWP